MVQTDIKFIILYKLLCKNLLVLSGNIQYTINCWKNIIMLVDHTNSDLNPVFRKMLKVFPQTICSFYCFGLFSNARRYL